MYIHANMHTVCVGALSWIALDSKSFQKHGCMHFILNNSNYRREKKKKNQKININTITTKSSATHGILKMKSNLVGLPVVF